MAVDGRIEGVVDGMLRGWVWEAEQPFYRCRAVLLLDGHAAGEILADRPRGDLQRNGLGDGAHGFEAVLPLHIQNGQFHNVALRCRGAQGAEILLERTLRIELRHHLLQGRVERINQGRVVGWVWDRAAPEATVAVEIWQGDERIAAALANQFRADLLRADIGSGASGFSFDLTAIDRTLMPGDILEVRAAGDYGGWRVGAVTVQANSMAAPATIAPRRAATSNRKPVLASAPAKPTTDVRALLQVARQAEAARDFTAAAKMLETALAASPRDFDLLFTRARVALALLDFDTGERFARAALRERPGHVRPTVLLARVAYTTGRHDEAAELWAAVPRGDAAWRERLVKRARSLRALSRTMEAMAEYAELARFDPQDREALRAVAEATEATGAIRTALRHWRRYMAVATDDQAVRDHVATLERSLAPSSGLASPLRDPWLRHWNGPVEGAVGPEGLHVTAGLRLSSLGGRNEQVAYAIGPSRERRPGDLPYFGLWMRTGLAGAEVRFALDPSAVPLLHAGLRMSVECQTTVGPPQDTVPIDLGVIDRDDAASRRSLHRWRVGSRPRLTCFELYLKEQEGDALARGGLWLSFTLPAGETILLFPPQPVMLPRPIGLQEAKGFEDMALMSGLAGLGAARD